MVAPITARAVDELSERWVMSSGLAPRPVTRPCAARGKVLRAGRHALHLGPGTDAYHPHPPAQSLAGGAREGPETHLGDGLLADEIRREASARAGSAC